MALTNKQWLMLLGVAILLTGYVMSWYRALKLAPVTLVTSVLVGATVITSMLNAIFVSKTFGLVELGQAVLIVMGMWLVLMAVIDGYKGGKLKQPAFKI